MPNTPSDEEIVGDKEFHRELGLHTLTGYSLGVIGEGHFLLNTPLTMSLTTYRFYFKGRTITITQQGGFIPPVPL